MVENGKVRRGEGRRGEARRGGASESTGEVRQAMLTGHMFTLNLLANPPYGAGKVWHFEPFFLAEVSPHFGRVGEQLWGP